MKNILSITIQLSLFLMLLMVGCGGKTKLPPQPIHETTKLARDRALQEEKKLEHELSSATKTSTDMESSPMKPAQPVQPGQTSSTSSQLTLPILQPFTEPKWIETTGEAYAQGRTAEEAQQLALANAYDNAVATAAGIHVDTTENRIIVETNDSFRDAFIKINRTDVRGHVTQADVPKWEPASLPNPSGGPPMIGYRVYVRVLVEPPKGERDTGFRVKAELNNETFREGEEITLRVTSTRDSFLTLFNFVSDGQVFLLIPSDVIANVPLKARIESQIPLPEQRSRGVHLRAGLPQGAKGSTESLLVVATREQFPPPKPKDDKPLTMLDVNRWLADIPRHEIAEDIAAFDIRRK